MAAQEQLAWESRAARPVAAAAFLAALLPVVGAYLGITIDRPDLPGDATTAESLLGLDRESGQALAGTIVQSLGVLALVPLFYYLWRAIKLRRPEFPRVAFILGMAGPVIYAVWSVLAVLDSIDIAQEFADNLPATGVEDRADDLVDEEQNVAVGVLRLVAQLALAISFVYYGLFLMRAGLMSRFMGTLGIIIGALYIIPLLGGPAVVSLFWLTAMGLLLLGIWPGGRGPAWETGSDDAWPSAYDQREAQERARLEAEEGAGPGSNGTEPESADPDTPRDEPVPKSRPRKRKRKRR